MYIKPVCGEHAHHTDSDPRKPVGRAGVAKPDNACKPLKYFLGIRLLLLLHKRRKLRLQLLDLGVHFRRPVDVWQRPHRRMAEDILHFCMCMLCRHRVCMHVKKVHTCVYVDVCVCTVDDLHVCAMTHMCRVLPTN